MTPRGELGDAKVENPWCYKIAGSVFYLHLEYTATFLMNAEFYITNYETDLQARLDA